MSRALVGTRERWKRGFFIDSALVGARQRWWAMIQVVLQLFIEPTITTPSTKTRSQGIWGFNSDLAIRDVGR
jgi:hypothetical protein